MKGKPIRNEASKLKNGNTCDVSDGVQTLQRGTAQKVKPVPSPIVKGKSEKVECDVSTLASSRGQTRKNCKAEAQKAVKDGLEDKQSEALNGGSTVQVPSRPTCKRGRGEALKPSSFSCFPASDNATTKYRRPHCPMCSQLGCLRNLEVICYCDPCQERKGAECSSPRMADFRKSHLVQSSRTAREKHIA